MTDDEQYKSPVEIFAEWWGDELRPATIERLAAAPMDHWGAFSEHYNQWRRAGVYQRRNEADTVAVYCSVDSPSDKLYEPELIPLGGARARALALYAHRVVVRDPLEPLVGDFLSAIKSEWGEPPGRESVARCLHVLSALVPLERSGAIRFAGLVTGDGGDPTEGSAAFRDLFALRSELSLESLDWRWCTDPSGIRGDGSGVLAGMNILTELMQARRIAPEGSVFIGTPLERSVLERLVSVGKPHIGKRAMTMANLATLAVPVLIPSPSDVVAVRASDEYVGFRSDLGRALGMVEDISSTDETWLATARAIMDDELAPGRESVSKAVRRSKALSEIKQVTAGFSVSALGATAGALVGGKPVPSLLAAATAGVATSLKSYLAARRSVRQRRAVLESYLMFGRPS